MIWNYKDLTKKDLKMDMHILVGDISQMEKLFNKVVVQSIMMVIMFVAIFMMNFK